MKEKGFTIIETLVALTLFSLAITGVLTVTLQGRASLTAASGNMTAQYLAQEGIELMRARRDSRILSSPGDFSIGWADFLSNEVASCSGNNRCDIEAHAPLLVKSCLSGTCGLRYVSSGSQAGYYTHTSTNPQYSRSIRLTQLQTDEVEVFVVVTWNEGSAPRRIELKESLFNWYAN